MTDAEKVTETPEEATPETEPAVAEEVVETAAEKPKATRSRAKKTETKEEPVGDSRYAVIQTGGKQYRVKVGDRIAVERLTGEAGADVTIDQVLLLGGDGSTKIGTPVVDGARVTATINEQARGDKIIVFKYKAKKRYRRRTGHRQELTRLTITGITG